MKSLEFEFVIIGGGCIGSSIFYELSRRGFKNIALLDYGRNTTSATANSGGLLRVFHENLEHINLALRHQLIFDRYQKEGIFSEIQKPNGSLYFFSSRRFKTYEKNFHKMAEAEYPFEIINGLEGQERFPGYRWSSQDCAIYEPLGHQFKPSIFAEDLLMAGTQMGSTVVDHFEVRRIYQHLDRYRISGNNTTVTARSLILAGGARLLPRLRDLGLIFPFKSKKLTAYLVEKTDKSQVFENYFDRETLEFGGFGAEKTIILSSLLPNRVIKTFGPFIQEQSAYDCYAPNRLGVVGKVPGYSSLILAMGWGGTAYKFALAVGRRVAEIVESEYKTWRVFNAKVG